MIAYSTCMEGLDLSEESRGSDFWKTISKALELHAVHEIQHLPVLVFHYLYNLQLINLQSEVNQPLY
jgi:hypothetical protein